MTRKHFQAIASLLADSVERFRFEEDHARMVHDMADTIGVFNPHFDRGKFLVAAGLRNGQKHPDGEE